MQQASYIWGKINMEKALVLIPQSKMDGVAQLILQDSSILESKAPHNFYSQQIHWL